MYKLVMAWRSANEFGDLASVINVLVPGLADFEAGHMRLLMENEHLHSGLLNTFDTHVSVDEQEIPHFLFDVRSRHDEQLRADLQLHDTDDTFVTPERMRWLIANCNYL